MVSATPEHGAARDADAVVSIASAPTRTGHGSACGDLHSSGAGHIVAMGGGGFLTEPRSPLDDFLLSRLRRRARTSCFVPTRDGRLGSGGRRVLRGVLGAARLQPDVAYDSSASRSAPPSASPPRTSSSSPAGTPRTCSPSGGCTASTAPCATAWERGAVLGGVSRRRELLVRGLRDRLVLGPSSTAAAGRARPPRRAASARTTTARSGVGRSTRELVADGFPPGYRVRRRRGASTSSARELVEVVAEPDPGAAATASRRAATTPIETRAAAMRKVAVTVVGERQRQDDRRPRARGDGSASRSSSSTRSSRAELDRDVADDELRAHARAARGRGRLGDRRRLPREDRRPRARRRPTPSSGSTSRCASGSRGSCGAPCARLRAPRGALERQPRDAPGRGAAAATRSSPTRFAMHCSRRRRYPIELARFPLVRLRTQAEVDAFVSDAPRPELGEPRGGAQPDPDRRQDHVEDDDRRAERPGTTTRPVAHGGAQPFSRRSPTPPGGGRHGCRSGPSPGAPCGPVRRSPVRRPLPPLDELDHAHRRLLDREVGDVEHGAAEPPMDRGRLLELLVDVEQAA